MSISDEEINVLISNVWLNELPYIDYQQEQDLMTRFLRGEVQQLTLNFIVSTPKNLAPLRARKDSALMFLSVYSRVAVKLGVENEEAYALTGYFFSKIESASDESALAKLVTQSKWAYRKLVQVATAQYSLHVHQAINFMKHHLFEHETISMVAEFAGISERHLSKLFQSELGCTPSDYLTDLKLIEAKRLLRQGHYTVTEISDMLGYSTASYFGKLFRKKTEMSPKYYSLQAQQEH